MRVTHLRARPLALPLIFLLLAVLVAPQPALAAPNAGPSAAQATAVYIVQLIDDPVVAYDGKIPGLKATRVNRGQKIDVENADVIAYASYLDSRHNAALS